MDEGQLVALDGSGSGPDPDVLTYAWEQLPGGTAVTLADADTAQPTFTAPYVALGGETLSFELTVTADDQVGITGVSDLDSNATITITAVTQDEPTNGLGDGDTAVDAVINPDGTVLLRAERAGNGNGRVYHVHFTASDLEGSASGVVTVSVPHQKKTAAVDGGELYLSTL